MNLKLLATFYIFIIFFQEMNTTLIIGLKFLLKTGDSVERAAGLWADHLRVTVNVEQDQIVERVAEKYGRGSEQFYQALEEAKDLGKLGGPSKVVPVEKLKVSVAFDGDDSIRTKFQQIKGIESEEDLLEIVKNIGNEDTSFLATKDIKLAEISATKGIKLLPDIRTVASRGFGSKAAEATLRERGYFGGRKEVTLAQLKEDVTAAFANAESTQTSQRFISQSFSGTIQRENAQEILTMENQIYGELHEFPFVDETEAAEVGRPGPSSSSSLEGPRIVADVAQKVLEVIAETETEAAAKAAETAAVGAAAAAVAEETSVAAVVGAETVAAGAGAEVAAGSSVAVAAGAEVGAEAAAAGFLGLTLGFVGLAVVGALAIGGAVAYHVIHRQSSAETTTQAEAGNNATVIV